MHTAAWPAVDDGWNRDVKAGRRPGKDTRPAAAVAARRRRRQMATPDPATDDVTRQKSICAGDGERRATASMTPTTNIDAVNSVSSSQLFDDESRRTLPYVAVCTCIARSS